jgi:hypothetical protein
VLADSVLFVVDGVDKLNRSSSVLPKQSSFGQGEGDGRSYHTYKEGSKWASLLQIKVRFVRYNLPFAV